MAKQKSMTIHFLRADTPMKLLKVGTDFCIAFDFEPNSRKQMLGVGTTDPAVAHALSSYFKQMAKALEKKKSGKSI